MQNLLNVALGVIPSSGIVLIERYIGETVNDIGSTINEYSPPETLYGSSVQPMPFTDVQNLGLVMGKRYISIWTSSNMDSALRGNMGDIITWNGQRWQLENADKWHTYNGWTKAIGVLIT